MLGEKLNLQAGVALRIVVGSFFFKGQRYLTACGINPVDEMVWTTYC
jgi:hypothetical protein